MTPKLNTGLMPGNPSYYYEEFETLLTSIYLTYLRLKATATTKKYFDQIETILNGFAERHGVQYPKDVFNNPRAFLDSRDELHGGDIRTLSKQAVDVMIVAMWRDFGIGCIGNTADSNEIERLMDTTNDFNGKFADTLFTTSTKGDFFRMM